MRQNLTARLFSFVAGFLLCFYCAPQAASAPTDEAAVLHADGEYVKALNASDGAALGKLLDADFTWTDSQGNTVARADFLHAIPKPELGDEAGVDRTERIYGQVAAVSASRGKTHVLRLWVHRSGGWRLLVSHAVTQLDQPSGSSGSGVNTCQNPCKEVPFKPANE